MIKRKKLETREEIVALVNNRLAFWRKKEKESLNTWGIKEYLYHEKCRAKVDALLYLINEIEGTVYDV